MNAVREKKLECFTMAVNKNFVQILNLLLCYCQELSLYSSAQVIAITNNQTASMDVFRLSKQQHKFFDAVLSDDKETVTHLLALKDSRIDVNANLGGETALHLAVTNNNAAMIILLINKNSNPSLKNKQQRTALELALDFTKNQSLDRWDCIVALTANSPDLLFNAAHICEKLDVCESLLANSQKIHLETLNTNSWDHDMTCLHLATQQKMPSLITLLLKNGADKNVKNKKDQTPLQLALSLGADYWDYIIILVGDDNQLLFDCAVICKKLDECERILANESIIIDPNKTLLNGATCLHLAVENSNTALIHLLKTKGANVNAKNKQNETPLDLALSFGLNDTACLVALLKDVALTSILLNTWLSLARKNDVAMLTFILVCNTISNKKTLSSIQQLVANNPTNDFSLYAGEMLYEYLLLNPDKEIIQCLGQHPGNKAAVDAYIRILPVDQRDDAIIQSKQESNALYIFFAQQKSSLRIFQNKPGYSLKEQMAANIGGTSSFFRARASSVTLATAYVVPTTAPLDPNSTAK